MIPVAELITLHDVLRAVDVGLARARARESSPHRVGDLHPGGEMIRSHVCSAIAEVAVARALDRPWLSDGPKPDDPGAGDVEGGIEVRWTIRREGGLIVRPTDLAPWYALCVGEPSVMQFAGMCSLERAHAPEFWRGDIPVPAQIVPQSALQLPSSLRKVAA